MPEPAIKVLYICHDAQYYGSQQSLRLILKHMPQIGVQCHVSVARSGPLEETLASESDVILHHHDRIQWVKHDRRGLLQRIGDVATLIAQCAFRPWKLARLIKDENIALVHTNSAVSLEGALAAKIAGVPHVWHIREIFMADNPKFRPVLGRQITRRLIEALSDRILCISQAVRSQFDTAKIERDPERYPVIYNAVDPPKKLVSPKIDVSDRSGGNRGPFRVGYVGRLSAGKRFHDLVEAIRILKTRKLEPDVLVAGTFVDTPYERRIEEQISQYRLTKQIRMLGYVDDPAQLYGNIDVLVVPSLNEPFGRVLIEAMQYGVLCVGANSGGVPEIITDGETGLLYPPRDTQALADLLEKIIRNPERADVLRRNARKMVETRFNIETQMALLVKSYQQALKLDRPAGEVSL